MRRLREIEILEEKIQSRILDHHHTGSWEQAIRVSADIKKKETELIKLKKKVSE